MSVQKFIYSLFGPNVYRIHRSNDASQRAFNYSSNKLESRSQAVLNFLSTTKSILYYTTPLWLVFLYRRGYCCMETMTDLAKFGGCASALFVALLITRGIGRTMNNDYCQFLNILSDAKGSPKNKDKKKLLRGYDFDFNHWPYDFRWDDVESKTSWSKPPSFWRRIRSQHNNIVSTVLIGIPEEILAYVISHTFGISLTYPGSMKLLQAAYGSALQDNRAKLVEQSGGIRSKLIARDGNSIDTMFVDKREK
uniref:Phosphatidylserine Lipase ABHD16 N-terminal domain-containing protein n=1 Tax=Ciona savignyi TaxID=51511 RepID=H2YBH6_CIOSA